MKSALVAVFALAASGAADLPRQFDYVCTYKEVGRGDELHSSLKVDLDRKLWCIDLCIATVPIVAIRPDKIVFADQSDATGSTHIEVSRPNGEFRYEMAITGIPKVLITRGKCLVGPFTGLKRQVGMPRSTDFAAR
jgi:hypothetical protein